MKPKDNIENSILYFGIFLVLPVIKIFDYHMSFQIKNRVAEKRWICKRHWSVINREKVSCYTFQ